LDYRDFTMPFCVWKTLCNRFGPFLYAKGIYSGYKVGVQNDYI